MKIENEVTTKSCLTCAYWAGEYDIFSGKLTNRAKACEYFCQKDTPAPFWIFKDFAALVDSGAGWHCSAYKKTSKTHVLKMDGVYLHL